MTIGSVYAKVVKRDDDGAVLRMELWRKGSRTWGDRKCGAVVYCENDNLCDIYSVVLDGHQIGIVEDYGNRVNSCPDHDGDDALFATVVKGLCTL